MNRLYGLAWTLVLLAACCVESIPNQWLADVWTGVLILLVQIPFVWVIIRYRRI